MPIVWEGWIENPTQPLITTQLATMQREAEATMVTLRDSPTPDPAALAKSLYRAGRCALLLGQGETALYWFSQAYQIEPDALLRVAQAQGFHFVGEYRTLYTVLTSLQAIPQPTPILQAMIQTLKGLTALDHAMLNEAQSALTAAASALRALSLHHDHFDVRLLLVETLTRAGKLTEAQTLLDTLDEDMRRASHQWFRPDWYARQAHILWLQGTRAKADKAARRGLGSIADRSSSRALSELYRLLAMTMGSSPQELEDARDARQRAVDAARAYSSRLALARSLHTIGLHTKLYSSRATDRARGSGFIYEAEQLYHQMALPTPAANATEVPFL